MATTRPSGYNVSVEEFRKEEYPMLKDSIYLDHAGTTLYAKSLMDRFAREMTSNLFGNPHSASASSQLSTARIEDVRLQVLEFFNASPAHFDVVFVSNATAGVKLVTEALRASPSGFNYAYHQSCHTSLVGVREEAQRSMCLEDAHVHDWLHRGIHPGGFSPDTPSLFAYPAQSNFDGRRFPLSWCQMLRRSTERQDHTSYSLLDAAAYVSTSPLDLSDPDAAPDFTVLSFYKIFGFPDLGALIVRRDAEHVFWQRRYFGGGTVDAVACGKEQWHAAKQQFIHERLEDGTLPIHSIVALGAAIECHKQLFGSMQLVAQHAMFLADMLHARLEALRHGNGNRVCVLYSPRGGEQIYAEGCGPVVAFNIRNGRGAWVELAEFEKLASLKKLHVRTGSVCNPGGAASALDLQPWEIARNFSSGFRCGGENDVIGGKPTGIIRASFGAMSTLADVEKFVAFIAEFYREASDSGDVMLPETLPSSAGQLRVHELVVYPIKSCAGFRIQGGVDWEVKPEGLAWDREWCLLHRGSGQALSQKRHPKMALIRPALDFQHGVLRVTFVGDAPGQKGRGIAIPLSNDPSVFEQPLLRSTSTRVCGESISAQTYSLADVNEFFSDVLGVPCMLARFPAGGQGLSMRHSKAHLQKHQTARPAVPGHLQAPPSPPDSDVEGEKRRILLSNESPILAINLSSLAALNEEIRARGGEEVSAAVFRANVVIGPAEAGESRDSAWEEDQWSTLRIGQQDFRMLGSCRRCHMVCINQETGAKNQEPFVTLSKTRRFDGKVFFGNHMGHVGHPGPFTTREAQHPTIRVGDAVFVDPL